jgi:integrase/recombinase XerD
MLPDDSGDKAGPGQPLTVSLGVTIYQPEVPARSLPATGRVTARHAPEIIRFAGKAAEFAWEEFFQGELANLHTRKNYMHAVRKFLDWSEERHLALIHVTPGDVGEYSQHLKLAIPTKKLHLAALRKFFDRMVNRHVVPINPAATVRAERYSVSEGKTPLILPRQAELLLNSITMTYQFRSQTLPDPVGLRDQAVLAVLVYTAARVGAVAKLTVKNLRDDGTGYSLRFSEKGGKSREIPVRHDLQKLLLAYIHAAGITDGPLFRTAAGKTKTLTKDPMTGIDICRMMKRRLKAAHLSSDFSPHSFRVYVANIVMWRRAVGLRSSRAFSVWPPHNAVAYRGTRSRAEGDICSEANEVRQHESRLSRQRAGGDPGGRVGVVGPKQDSITRRHRPPTGAA